MSITKQMHTSLPPIAWATFKNMAAKVPAHARAMNRCPIHRPGGGSHSNEKREPVGLRFSYGGDLILARAS